MIELPACLFLLLLGLALPAAASGAEPPSAPDLGGASAAPLVYPEAPRGPQVDTWHGEVVADPYRWLEEIDSSATRRWVEQQNALTRGWLDGIPARPALRARLERLQDHERFSTPWREGSRTFWFRNAGLQNQAVLYWTEGTEGTGSSEGIEEAQGGARVALDPNLFSEDGTVALAGVSVSRDGEWLAYGLTEAGSDWSEWRVRRLDTGEDLPDRLRWVKFSGASWSPDGRGFYYSRYPAPAPGADLEQVNRHHRVYHHVLGTPQAEDRLVYSREDHPEWLLGAGVTEDGRFLTLAAHRPDTTHTALFAQDLTRPGAEIVAVREGFDAVYSCLDSLGDRLLVLTDRGAPTWRLLSMGLDGSERELIGPAPETLESVSRVGDRLFAAYLVDAISQVRVFDLEGRPQGAVALPGLGSVGGFQGRPEDTDTFYTFTSTTRPATVYRYDLESGRSRIWRRPRVDFDPEQFESRQVFVESPDGARVPMLVSHRRGLPLDGQRPTLLYGYGGFGISLTPAFSTRALAWMERGGVYAVANLRGGGEYGEAWHKAGTRLHKQRVFDDFIACAERLIEDGITRPSRLAIQGGSNGGLLVAACMVQRPELFGACVAQVGVLDMLRFPRFTIGYHWVSDYGSPDDPEEYRALRAYSPYHNLRPGVAYPATLVTTGDHDDRVFPGHSFKFAAALQACGAGPAPALIRVETRAGHGAGKPTWLVLEEGADLLAFLLRALGVE